MESVFFTDGNMFQTCTLKTMVYDIWYVSANELFIGLPSICLTAIDIKPAMFWFSRICRNVCDSSNSKNKRLFSLLIKLQIN